MYLEQMISTFAICNRSIYAIFLYLQYIDFVFAIYDRSLYTMFLYLQYIDKFTPKRRVLVEDERDASGLSDDELAAELEDLIEELRSEDA